jgi:hypothetical protein
LIHVLAHRQQAGLFDNVDTLVDRWTRVVALWYIRNSTKESGVSNRFRLRNSDPAETVRSPRRSPAFVSTASPPAG